MKGFDREELDAYLEKLWKDFVPDKNLEKERSEEILRKIFENDVLEEQVTKVNWNWITTVAASLLLLVGLFFFMKNKNQEPLFTQNSEVVRILPGGNKALLTLDDGTVVDLDSVEENGLAALSGKVTKLANGRLKYNGKKEEGEKVTYNTITTPKGGQYEIILADGSKIWLNAASSIRFPTAFEGLEREVTVQGEIYAEIARDEKHPFKVHVLSKTGEDRGTINVLGTSFNINAYEVENKVITTLIDGSLAVEKGNSKALIKPGEQVLVEKEDLTVEKAENLEGIIAWKNGKFDFEGVDIKEVMKRIGDWYDIRVEYESVPEVHFVGSISRAERIETVLNILEMTGTVKFAVEGRKITVKE